MRSNYWSCSKFADWVRGMPKPKAGTAEEWNAWHKSAKVNKFRYWLAENGLDYVQDFINFPKDRIAALRHYINNRWISKTHAMTSNLKRGHWHEFETRLFHSAFDELVDFVEIEQAWMHAACCNEARKKYKVPWYRTIFRIRSWRSPEAGLAYLEWAGAFKADEEWLDKNDPDFGQPTRHALAAQETLALYKWWKEERAKRPDPMDASGWSDYCEEKRTDEEEYYFGRNESEEERKRAREILDICNQIEREHDNEDTEMLIRLVRLRTHLWT